LAAYFLNLVTMKLTAALVLILSTSVLAQSPEVPHKMEFAGITLTIRDDARREIQKDVDLFTQSQKHFNIKVQRARTYFPIIEKIFNEEGLPDDFKFLVLQESALISDAVSVSNAVGFWQFKDFTAIEMGLRVDKEIDERMNIEASSRAAARYLKKNNMYFNNWIYALQAYQMGAGGVQRSVSDYESGTKHMEITSKTYWYVKKFLAHKVAYQGFVSGGGEIQLLSVMNQTRKSMTELAKEFALPEEELKSYNKWVRTNFIPGDRPYRVFIPTAGNNRTLVETVAKSVQTTKLYEQPARVEARPAVAGNSTRHVNGVLAMQAIEDESITAFVKRANIDLSLFLKYNDLSISDQLIPGEYYYLKRKKTRASVPQYVVKNGEDLWSVSHKYGVQLKRIKKYNNLPETNRIKEGTVLYLAGKPGKTPAINPEEVVQVQPGDTFNWSVKPETQTSSAKPAVISPISESSPNNVKVEKVEADSISMVSSQPLPGQHTVAVGETLYAIAKRHQVTVMQLAEWNNLNLQQGIKPGQVLNLSAESGESSASASNETDELQPITHLVKASDTLYGVARQYGVTIKDLMDWNNKKDFTLTVGESLKILKKQ
jgi:membrane-bound lytic murein transglycosylase D